MDVSHDVGPVLRQFPVLPVTVQPVASDGFSGARLWRVSDGARQYALRRWPVGTLLAKVKSIHLVQTQVDLPFIPKPVAATSLESFVAHADSIWTLQPWMPGRCLEKLPPAQAQLSRALQALAEFHRAAATVCFHDPPHANTDSSAFPKESKGPPPGLRSRAALAAQYFDHRLHAIRTAHVPIHLGELLPRRERLIPLFLETARQVFQSSRPALNWEIPLQACIRDIHASHVLFTGDQVTGMIDFDAMRLDCVATDLARLLASYCGDEMDLWENGLAAYSKIRQLSDEERDLVRHYDRFAVLLTGLQWLDWILLEHKEFDLTRVLPRIDATLVRLEHLRDRLRIGPG